jgi:hypothetical protein
MAVDRSPVIRTDRRVGCPDKLIDGRSRNEAQTIHERQIIGILKEHAAGAKVVDLSRRRGVSERSTYRWKAKYGDMDVSDAKPPA